MNDASFSVRVEGLRFQYPDVAKAHVPLKDGRAVPREALAGLDFVARTGRITGLLGPNGSGKSTSFKILSTQIAPQQGDALVFGHSVAKDPKRVRELIGVTFQAPSLDPWLTVEENLRVQAALYGLPAAETNARLEELLGAFDLKEYREARVKTLSGGLARRAELAKTLLAKPKLLLLDEPTTGLDPRARLAFWAELKKLRDRGLSLLVTTHLMEEADLCDEICIINRGRLVKAGTPEELKASMGREVLIVEATGLEARFELWRSSLASFGEAKLVDGRLRLETRQPEEALSLVRSRFGADLRSLSIGKPTLADIYLSATGEALS